MKRRRTHGITFVETSILIAIAALLAAISFPALFRNRQKRQASRCGIQLEAIAMASQRFASEKGGMPSNVEELVPGYALKVLVCPAGGTYTIGTPEGDPPRCSIPGHSL
ncbi:MAG: hypothetical protein LBN38_00285 [Verrucomicrobiota bacterium]|jgi:type II secretory pathway pseudopilin PulG|nr:hypothetical protein [Verrucomicrobiota bacterium]